MTSLGENGEIVSRHDSGVVQLNLAQDEVIKCLLVFHTPTISRVFLCRNHPYSHLAQLFSIHSMSVLT